MDGRVLAREFCLRHPALRVLFLSGYAPDTIAARGAVLADGELLPKPFTRPVLLAKVRAFLDAQ
jgi:DNA-binding response OmpR family regulator